MTTTARPLAAIALEPDGRPGYPFQNGGPEGAVLFAFEPRLPSSGCRWVAVPAGDDRPHMDLDRLHLAQLIYCSTADPDSLVSADEADLAQFLTARLTACRCDPALLDHWYNTDFIQCNLDGIDDASRRMHRCLDAADLLLGTP